MSIPPPLRLPSDAGVTFEGFEELVIPSRTQVKGLLHSFLAAMGKAPGPMIRVILGWWGEGKTDAYGRYLRPSLQQSGDLPIFVAASSVANSYERPDVEALSETTSLSALRFLTVLLAACHDENPELGIGPLAGTPEKYVGDNLLALTTGKHKVKNAVFFIDEFEELLLHPHLNDIISGLKEVVNAPQSDATGVRQWLFDKGRLGGKVHFVLACTPDAFYRLESNAETALIFGGLGRRQGVVELPPISKREGVRFLLQLLEYCYEGKLPHELDFRPGVLDALSRAGQLNLGNLVSLFTRFLTFATSQGDRVSLDCWTLVDALWNQTTAAYGSQTRCIETDLVDRLERALAERSKVPVSVSRKIVRMVIGEPRPHKAEDAAARLDLSPKEVKNLVGLLNDTARSLLGLGPAIVRVVPVHVAEDALRTEFAEWIHVEGDKAYVKLDDFSDSWDGFLDKVSFLDGKEEAGFELFLPCDDQSVLAYFEGISAGRAGEIANKARRIGEEDTHYLSSESFLQHIFPAAVPRQIDFIRDRKVRLDIWRDVSRNLRSHFESSLADALIGFLPFLKRFSVEAKREIRMLQNMQDFTVRDLKINASVKSVLYCTPGDLTSGEVESVGQHLGDLPPVHGAWAFYGGSILPEAATKIQDKGLDKDSNKKFVHLRVHPTLAKMLLAAWLSKKEHPEVVNSADLEDRVRTMMKDDLGFEERWDQWILSQQRAGWYIGDMTLNSAASPKEATDALRFFINYSPEALGPKEALERNTSELSSFVMYGSKMGLFPDIESDTRLRAVAEDLLLNGFLKMEGTKFRVTGTEIENRILELVRVSPIVEDKLGDYFIMGAKQKRTLKDAYLPTLEYKGLISREHGTVKLMSKSDWDTLVSQRPLAPLDALRDRLGAYGHVFVTKQRESKLILISEFISFIDSLRRRRETEGLDSDESACLRTSSLIIHLQDYFAAEIVPVMNTASRLGDELGQSLEKMAQDTLIQIEKVTKDALKWTKTVVSPEAIQEYSQVKRLMADSSTLIPKADSRSVPEDLLSKLSRGEYDLFRFDAPDQSTHSFNLVVYRRRVLLSDLENLVSRCAKPIVEMTRGFADIEGRQRTFERALAELRAPTDLASGKFIQALARLGAPGGDMPPNSLPKSDLFGLSQIVASILSQLSEQYLQSQNALAQAHNLIRAESDLKEAIRVAMVLNQTARNLLPEMGPERTNVIVSRIEMNMQTAITQLTSAEVPANLPGLMSTIRSLERGATSGASQIREDSRTLSQTWRNFADRQSEVLRQIARVAEVVALKKKIPIPPKLQHSIDHLIDELNRNLDQTGLTHERIRSERETVTKELALLAKGFASEQALLVLSALMGTSSKSGSTWTSFDELAEEVQNRYNIDRSQLAGLVAELRNANVVTEGLALKQ